MIIGTPARKMRLRSNDACNQVLETIERMGISKKCTKYSSHENIGDVRSFFSNREWKDCEETVEEWKGCEEIVTGKHTQPN